MRAIDPTTRYVVAASGCWEWMGPRNPLGYGEHGGRKAHRLVYERLIGPIPPALELDHLCRNPPCVNPAHLEPVTHLENVRRGRAGLVNGARQKALTHCKRGHEFSAENTRIDRRGERSCRECSRLLHRSYYQRDLAASRSQGRTKARARYALRKGSTNAS